jgi:hypothetical protein
MQHSDIDSRSGFPDLVEQAAGHNQWQQAEQMAALYQTQQEDDPPSPAEKEPTDHFYSPSRNSALQQHIPTDYHESQVSSSLIEAHINMYQSGNLELAGVADEDKNSDANSGEKPVLILMRDDPTSTHIVKYIVERGSTPMFDILFFDDLSEEEVPSWLEGVPSIAFESCRVLTAVDCIMFIREMVQGSSLTDKSGGMLSRDMQSGELVVNLKNNSSSSWAPIYADEQKDNQTIEDLLPLPLAAEVRIAAAKAESDNPIDGAQMQALMRVQMENYKQMMDAPAPAI